MAEAKKADEMFKEFKEHSISEFFKKNKQMLGYAGMVRSLVTVVHEYVTNSLDACEEAGILPLISIRISNIGENKYSVVVSDNGPGIPKKYIGKALATILAGTKFHRYMQQRGQQGIGASGCTLFSQMTTGKQIKVKSVTGNVERYSCSISIDTVQNKPVISDYKDIEESSTGLSIEAEFATVKYENSDHGVYEYLKRTALANPHMEIRFVDPDNKEYVFIRAVNEIPKRPKPTKPHPLGISVNDLIEFAHKSESRKISVFLEDTFARVSSAKVNELGALTGLDMKKDPRKLEWDDAERLVKGFKQVKWIAPETSIISPIGEDQIKVAMKNILNPDFINVVERKPSVFYGGIPFVVEAAISFGGNSGKKLGDDEYSGSILRFANRVPLLFDSGSCAITQAVRSIQWKRYGIDIENQPVSVFVNVSSVYIPYSGVGKEAIASTDEIIDEIKLALMDAARGMQRYIRGKQQFNVETNKYKTIMRYAKRLSKDLNELTREDEASIEKSISTLVASHYPKATEKEDTDGQAEDEADPLGK